MVAINIALKWQGLAEMQKLAATLQQGDDFTKYEDDIFAVMQADVDRRFAEAPGAGGGNVYGGKSWPGLTQAYLAQNPRRATGQILRDTGELQQSFQVGLPGNVNQIGKSFVRFGSNLPKARGNQAKRPMIFGHAQLYKQIGRVIETNWESLAS